MAEHTEQSSTAPAWPLARAAEGLGISPDALRMRVKRGTAEGFKRGGRLFVYMHGEANNVRSAADAYGAAAYAGAGERELAAIIELQRVELNRLLRENERLSRRINRLLAVHERELALRQQTQQTIDRLTRRPGASDASGPSAERTARQAVAMERLEARLSRAEGRADRLKQVVERLVHLLDPDPDPDPDSDPGSGPDRT